MFSLISVYSDYTPNVNMHYSETTKTVHDFDIDPQRILGMPAIK